MSSDRLNVPPVSRSTVIPSAAEAKKREFSFLSTDDNDETPQQKNAAAEKSMVTDAVGATARCLGRRESGRTVERRLGAGRPEAHHPGEGGDEEDAELAGVQRAVVRDGGRTLRSQQRPSENERKAALCIAETQ